MSSHAPRRPQGIFISPSGLALSRWREAFPRLQCVPAARMATLPADSTLVWLRLDAALPAGEQLASLRRAAGELPVIVLADRPNDDEALALFAAGIRGYCNSHATAANLRHVAKVVQAGGLWIGPQLMGRLVAATGHALALTPRAEPAPAEAAASLAVLTRRELEVARCIAGGASNKEIARRLGISERTVKAHAGAIFGKLGARDRLHLALMVNGLGGGTARAARADSRNMALHTG